MRRSMPPQQYLYIGRDGWAEIPTRWGCRLSALGPRGAPSSMVRGAERRAREVGAQRFHHRLHRCIRAGEVAHVHERVAGALHDLEVDLEADVAGGLRLAGVPDLFEAGDFELEVLFRIGAVDPGERVALQEQAARPLLAQRSPAAYEQQLVE